MISSWCCVCTVCSGSIFGVQRVGVESTDVTSKLPPGTSIAMEWAGCGRSECENLSFLPGAWMSCCCHHCMILWHTYRVQTPNQIISVRVSIPFWLTTATIIIKMLCKLVANTITASCTATVLILLPLMFGYRPLHHYRRLSLQLLRLKNWGLTLKRWQLRPSDTWMRLRSMPRQFEFTHRLSVSRAIKLF